MILQILYEDGDVEVINLQKEQWELIDTGGKTAKVFLVFGFCCQYLSSLFLVICRVRSFELNKYSYNICTYCRSPEHQREIRRRKGNILSAT
jgi:hypothetical protein